MSCEHELKTLSEPVVDLELTIFGGHGLHYPPIFQCVKCHKVFKTGYDEWGLVEIPVMTIEDIEKEQSEYVPNKRKVSSFVIWMTLFILGLSILIIMLLLFLME